MSEDQFTKLFNHIEKRLDGADERFDRIDANISNVRGAIAELSAQIRDYYNESIFLNSAQPT